MLTKEQIEELAGFDTPTVCNAIECFNLRDRTEGYTQPGLYLRTSDAKPMVGYAATAQVSGKYPFKDTYENLMGYYEHVRETGLPTIAVIEDLDKVPSAAFWGEVQATVHMSLGCVGTVIQGGVRDIPESGKLGFKFYSTEINVAHGYTHVVNYAQPVTILGMTVRPGDLLHVDQHGATVIPHEIAPKLAKVCRAIADAEMPMLEPCRQAIREGRIPTMDEIKKWRKAMDDLRKESLSKIQ